MRLRRALGGAGLLLCACSGTDAGLITVTGTTRGVLHLELQLATQNGKHKDALTAPEAEAEPLTFPRTIAVTFPYNVSGYLLAHVDAKAGTAVLAQGNGFAAIVKGGVTEITLPLKPVDGSSPPDAGAEDGGK